MIETLILAFSPTDAEYAKNGYHWSLYDPTLENPYNVDNGTEKLKQAITQIDPDHYSLDDDEWWVRLDWHSIIEGEPERVWPDETEETLDND